MYIYIEERVSYKLWRNLVRKHQRKCRRKALAQKRDVEEAKKLAAVLSDPEYILRLKEQERLELENEVKEEILSLLKKEEWMARDAALHSLWLSKKKQKQQEQNLIVQEKMCLEEEKKENYKEKAHTVGKQEQEQTSLCHNPEPPLGYERHVKQICPFFKKTGACRFGPSCSREHEAVLSSRCLLLSNMYSHIGLHSLNSEDYDTDSALEYTEADTYFHFKDFFYDVLSEFSKMGRVIQLKVCRNRTAHLRGNVYLQYERLKYAETAQKQLNGRWYAGRQISCCFVAIQSWKSAICGQYLHNCCPKGPDCNFLHTFKNPENMFSMADVDIYHNKRNRESKSERSFYSGSRKSKENRRSLSPRRPRHYRYLSCSYSEASRERSRSRSPQLNNKVNRSRYRHKKRSTSKFSSKSRVDTSETRTSDSSKQNGRLKSLIRLET